LHEIIVRINFLPFSVFYHPYPGFPYQLLVNNKEACRESYPIFQTSVISYLYAA